MRFTRKEHRRQSFIALFHFKIFQLIIAQLFLITQLFLIINLKEERRLSFRVFHIALFPLSFHCSLSVLFEVKAISSLSLLNSLLVLPT